MSEEEHHLTAEEKVKVVAQVDYFLSILSTRYSTTPEEIIEAIKWVRDRRKMADKIKSSFVMTSLGILLSAIALAAWEGIKLLARRP